MEATSNFAHALETVYNERKESGLLVKGDVAVFNLIRQPMQMGPNGFVNNMDRVHRRVRRLYIRKTWDLSALFVDMDWNSILDWLKENWDEILKIILVIIPLFI